MRRLRRFRADSGVDDQHIHFSAASEESGQCAAFRLPQSGEGAAKRTALLGPGESHDYGGAMIGRCLGSHSAERLPFCDDDSRFISRLPDFRGFSFRNGRPVLPTSGGSHKTLFTGTNTVPPYAANTVNPKA